jgi:hypothetical protein
VQEEQNLVGLITHLQESQRSSDISSAPWAWWQSEYKWTAASSLSLIWKRPSSTIGFLLLWSQLRKHWHIVPKTKLTDMSTMIANMMKPSTQSMIQPCAYLLETKQMRMYPTFIIISLTQNTHLNLYIIYIMKLQPPLCNNIKLKHTACGNQNIHDEWTLRDSGV